MPTQLRLKAQNLVVLETYPNRLTVRVSGTVAQLNQVLGVDFKRVTVEGRQYVAATTAPSIPVSFADFVLGINGLQPYQHAFTPHPILQPQSPSQPFVPPYSVNDIRTAYEAKIAGLTGAGQRTAILIDTFPNSSDLTSFWSANQINQSLSNIEEIQAVAGSLPAPSGEESLDVEFSSGIAPQSRVRIYATTNLTFTNLDQGFQRIINDLNSGVSIQQLSISLGACENQLPASELNTENNFLATIASHGVSILVASGDQGSNCPTGFGSVDFEASSPNVTAVGGTNVQLYPSGARDISWSGSGGGSSTFFPRPIWQNNTGISGNNRLVPDVSLDADPNTGYYIVLNGQVLQIGGTSASAPTWAGFIALVNQSRANKGLSPIGFLNPSLYPLLGTSSFKDITIGNNGAFNAGPGYDLVTGIGVPVFSNLLPALGG